MTIKILARRHFFQKSAQRAALLLTFSVAGSSLLLAPAEALARQLPLQRLSAAEAGAINLLAEALVPGAAKAGVAHFIDNQLVVTPDESMLIAKYFQVPPPYHDFYRRGIGALSGLAAKNFGKDILQLDSQELRELLAASSRPGSRYGEVDIFTFYLCLRSDAVDVVYGTPEGFEKLDVPYMAHIMPPEVQHG